ncbi:hypothetical protein RYX51_11015 [Priestia filamentosa]|nr:hypothetical protein RYX51_11015 [Priestia filamentosa]
MNPIRVVLIEDDIDWLNIMETIIGNEDDIVLVGCGTTKEEAINLSKAQQKHVGNDYMVYIFNIL